MRSFSPSLILTWTRTVSPGLTSGMSLRCNLAASFSMMGCCDMFFSSSIQGRCDVRNSKTFSREFRERTQLFADSRFSRSFAANIFFADVSQNLFVLFAQRLPVQQVRAVAHRFFQRFAATPLAYLLMVAAYQHFRHRHAAKLRRTRVMRIIQQAAGTARAIGPVHAGFPGGDKSRAKTFLPC